MSDDEPSTPVRGALVETAFWQYLAYDAGEDRLRQLEYGNQADIEFAKAPSQRSQGVLFGGAEARELHEYMVVKLDLVTPDLSYLFWNRNGQRRPVGRTSARYHPDDVLPVLGSQTE